MIRTLLFVSVFLLVWTRVQSQDHIVKIVPNRYHISWETVAISDAPDLGFVGFGFDIFNLLSQNSNIYFGINSYSTMSGNRPGLITFGVSAGWQAQLFNKYLYLDIGSYIGGGGGGGASDGGGLILRPHIFLEKKIGNIGLKTGLSHLGFPSGEIKGNQINFGINFYDHSIFKVESFDDQLNTDPVTATKTLRVAVVSTMYSNYSKKSIQNNSNEIIGLIGIQLERNLTPHWYGILKTSGAIKGNVAGYMSILLGAGRLFTIIPKRASFETRLLMGPSGGGGIKSGGGATAQAEFGLSFAIGNSYDVKLMTGKTWAPWGDFKTNHLELSLGKTIGFPSTPLVKDPLKKMKVPSKSYDLNHLAFTTFNRTYFPPNNRDKNGLTYLNSFQLIGFEVQKYIGNHFRIHGGTVWAYQGDYGAYAEGLLGATYSVPLHSDWEFIFKGNLGAGGGGGIMVRNGLLFQGAVGIEKSINSNWSTILHFGKLIPLDGSFTPYSLDIGFKLHLSSLFKKSLNSHQIKTTI